MFEKGVLKKLFGWWGKGVAGYLRRIHNCELRDFYNSQNIAKLIMGACMQSEKNLIFVSNFGSSRKN